MRQRKRWGRRAAVLVTLWAAAGAAGRAATEPDYINGVKWFPRFWRAYQQQTVPPPNLTNTGRLAELIHDGKLELSLAQALSLVEDNSLDLTYSVYNVKIAETDILRAKSGQAARGAPGVPLPGALFASAVGAGIGAASNIGGGGTGPAAISGSTRQIVVGPRGAFDPDVQFSYSFDRTSSPLNTLQVAGIGNVITPSSVVQTRFEKAFSTGTSFSVSFNSQRQSSTQQFLLFNPAVTGRLSVSAYQPLLNGFGFAINRRFINIARNDLQISREQFRQQVTTDVINAQNAYWDLVAAREIVRAAEQSTAAAQELANQNQRQFEAGVMSRLDVVQAQSELAANRRDLLVAQTNAQMKEIQLKSLLTKNLAALYDVRLVLTDKLPAPAQSDFPNLRAALDTALHNRSEVKQARLNIENQRTAEKYTRSALKPTFSVFALYASSSLVGGIGPMFQQVWQQIPYPEYAVGFSLSFPLWNRAAQADNARAQVEIQQSETAFARTENQIGLDVRGAIIALLQSKARVEAAAHAAESSRAALDAERAKFRLGASTGYLVIQMDRDYVNAQSQEVQARASYAKALVQLNHATGTTLQHHNISVDDLLARLR